MTKKLFKPSAEDKRIIRDCARREAGRKTVEVNPSTKILLDGTDHNPQMNIALLTDDPDFNDTDLFSNAFTWSDFGKGFPLAKGGRAIVDFYVYSTGKWGELEGNVTAYWEAGELVKVDGVMRNWWTKGGAL